MPHDESALRLEQVRRLGALESGLAVVVTYRPDGSVQASVVNAGVLEHPVTGERVVGFVARGGAGKLTNLQSRPLLTVVFRSGWEWVAVEGSAELAGPDDQFEGLERKRLPRLLRTVYAAAVGGTEGDWADLDAAVAAEGHTAVLVVPVRTYWNPR